MKEKLEEISAKGSLIQKNLQQFNKRIQTNEVEKYRQLV